MKQRVSVSRSLLSWFRKNRRDFLWRNTSSPYKILVCELLLKKTRAETVDKLAPAFFNKYPTLASIAGTRKRKLQQAIKPFGLYRQRAEHLKKLAVYITRYFNEKVPATQDELLLVPGIGAYTANAVLCFAFGVKVPLIDANTVRIFSRLFSISCNKGELRRNKIFLDRTNQFYSSIRTKRIKEFNWALLDLGALVCKIGNSACDVCPLKNFCKSANNV